jgi:sugar transferase EpsL
MTAQPATSRRKRTVDLGGAMLALIVLGPLMLLIAVIVLVTTGRPVLFEQRRLGLGGQPFTIRKFRTMRAPKPGEDWSRTDAVRLTRFGRWLRKSSCDELPELYNVLCGDMSLVGPRPLVLEYRERFTFRHMRRHEARPGITGLAQVSGRENIPFSRRLELDVWYVDNWSLWLDMKIMVRTLSSVITARGVDSVTIDMADDVGLASDRSRFIAGEEDVLPVEAQSSGRRRARESE